MYGYAGFALFDFFGIVYALKLIHDVLMRDVQHPFPYQTKGLEEI